MSAALDAVAQSRMTAETTADNETLHAAYWDGVFGDTAEPTEWLLSYASSGRFFRTALERGLASHGPAAAGALRGDVERICGLPALPRDPSLLQTLIVGCGNSPFSVELAAELETSKICGCGDIIASDFSSTVVAQMKARYSSSSTSSSSSSLASAAAAAPSPAQSSSVVWEVQDARRLSYADASCIAYVDKSLVDCISYAADCAPALKELFAEAYRVLAPGGVALFLTQSGPDVLEPFLDQTWHSCAFVPIAAECDAEGNVLPTARCVTDDEIDAAFGETAEEGDDFETILLYICVKPLEGAAKGTATRSGPAFQIDRVEDMSPYLMIGAGSGGGGGGGGEEATEVVDQDNCSESPAKRARCT